MSISFLAFLYLAIAADCAFLSATLFVGDLYELTGSSKHSRDQWHRRPRKFVFEWTQHVLACVALVLIGLAAEMAATPGWPWIFIVCFVAGSVFTRWRHREYLW